MTTDSPYRGIGFGPQPSRSNMVGDCQLARPADPSRSDWCLERVPCACGWINLRRLVMYVVRSLILRRSKLSTEAPRLGCPPTDRPSRSRLRDLERQRRSNLRDAAPVNWDNGRWLGTCPARVVRSGEGQSTGQRGLKHSAHDPGGRRKRLTDCRCAAAYRDWCALLVQPF